MGGYILTFLAALFKGVLSFFMDGSVQTAASKFGAGLVNGIVIILLVIGVAISFFKSKGFKMKMISLAANAILFLVGTLLTKAFVPVALVIGIAIFVIIRFNITLPFLNNDSAVESCQLPNLIYDQYGNPYSKLDENPTFARYRSDVTGAEITIYIPATGVTGNSINSSSGYFYWP